MSGCHCNRTFFSKVKQLAFYGFYGFYCFLCAYHHLRPSFSTLPAPFPPPPLFPVKEDLNIKERESFPSSEIQYLNIWVGLVIPHGQSGNPFLPAKPYPSLSLSLSQNRNSSFNTSNSWKFVIEQTIETP